MILGLIGVGNMGGAILQGAVRNGYLDKDTVWISDIDQSAALRVSQRTGAQVAKNNIDLVQRCDLILLAVKPVFLKGLLDEIGPFLNGKAVLSIAAGWTMAMLGSAVPDDTQVMRAMPNTPALVGEGMTALCAEHTFNESALSFAEGLFESIGRVCVIPERLFDGFIAVSGSSPAYVFMMIEAMADAAVKEGIFRKDAYQMAAQAVLGSAKLLLETGKHPGELKDMVCSPAGTTIEAVAALESGGFRASIIEAMSVCAEKSREMSK